jgi:hypothetical protein
MKLKKPIEEWFPIPDDEDGARVRVKHLSPGDVQDIVDETFKISPEFGGDAKGPGDVTVKSSYNQKLEREMTLTRVITGLENFFDEEGKPIERTDENVLLLSRKVEGFNEFVSKCRVKVAEIASKKIEVEEKN